MTEDQLKRILNAELADFFGKQTRHFDQRFDDLRFELKDDIDQVRTTLDGIAKRLDNDTTEQVVTNNRHEEWIRQLGDSTDTKLVPEP